MRRAGRRGGVHAVVVATVLALPAAVRAHNGPPFPIVMDHVAGDFTVSVWADPDVGEARFYVLIDGPAAAVPDLDVRLSVQPISGRLDRVSYPGSLQRLRNRIQYEVRPHFDQEDTWNVEVEVRATGADPGQVVVMVESTPPGLGAWDLAIYLFPFLLLGGLWMSAMLRRRAPTLQ